MRRIRPGHPANPQPQEICLRHTVGLIAFLQDGIDRGSLPPQPVQALTYVLVGAVDEAALYIAGIPQWGRFST